MWRVLGLTFVLLTSTTAVANAKSRLDTSAGRIETALYQSSFNADETGAPQHSSAAAPQLQVGGALA